MNSKIRSPFFYVGDKYKLMNQLLPIFPKDIKGRFIEPFVGGGSVYLNTHYKNCLLNDSSTSVIKLHKYLSQYKNINDLMNNAEKIIYKYGLSYSYKNKELDEKLVKKYPKTYFAEMNRSSYLKLREDFNNSIEKNSLELYLLMIYGFNRMIRYNANGDFNIPVGNVDFNQNVFNALQNYVTINKKKKVKFLNLDFRNFFENQEITKEDFVYIDPPYLISHSEYNKYWTEDNDVELYNEIDKLNNKNIKFVLSNILIHKGKENKILKNWSKNYKLQYISSNYISYHDNTNKKSKEIIVTNL